MLLDGATLDKAAYSGGRESTVDFNRGGDWGNYFNTAFPFWKAGISANSRLMRNLYQERDPKAGFGLMAKIVMAGYVYSTMMRLWAGEDDDTEEKHWDRLTPWDKRHNMNLFLGDGEGSRISLPLPYGWNMLYGFGSDLSDFASSKAGLTTYDYSAGEMAFNTLSSFSETFHPMGGGHGINRIIPHIIRPISEIQNNVDFSGKKIMPDQNPWNPDKPDSERYWRTVNPISVQVARKVNSAFGGDEFEASSWLTDFSPETMDHVISYYGGTMARQLWNLAGETWKVRIDGKPPDWRTVQKNIPVAGKLYKPATDDYNTISTFIALRNTVALKERRIKKLQERGDRALASDHRRVDATYLALSKEFSAHNSRKQFLARKIAHLKSKKAKTVEIQRLEKLIDKEELEGMSRILAKARKLGIPITV